MRKINWNKVYATVGVLVSVVFVGQIGMKFNVEPAKQGSGTCTVTAYHPAPTDTVFPMFSKGEDLYNILETEQCGTVKTRGLAAPPIVGKTYVLTWIDNPNPRSKNAGRVATSITP